MCAVGAVIAAAATVAEMRADALRRAAHRRRCARSAPSSYFSCAGR